MEIDIDFVKDLEEIMKKELLENGFKMEVLNKDKLKLQYYNYYRRLIPPKKWTINYSNEFNCPEAVQEGLNMLIEKLSNGLDIKPNLSRKITDLNYDDDLLNDWDIYHLHLGLNLEQDGFIERTNFVLYLYKKNNDLYLLNVLDHSHFNDQNLVTIIHNNWPELIDSFLVKEAIGVLPKITNKDIKKFRKKHIMSFIEPIPGIVYLPMGLGSDSNGKSNDVVQRAEGIIEFLKALEKTALFLLKKAILTNKYSNSEKNFQARLIYDNYEPYATLINYPEIKEKLAILLL